MLGSLVFTYFAYLTGTWCITWLSLAAVLEADRQTTIRNDFGLSVFTKLLFSYNFESEIFGLICDNRENVAITKQVGFELIPQLWPCWKAVVSKSFFLSVYTYIIFLSVPLILNLVPLMVSDLFVDVMLDWWSGAFKYCSLAVWFVLYHNIVLFCLLWDGLSCFDVVVCWDFGLSTYLTGNTMCICWQGALNSFCDFLEDVQWCFFHLFCSWILAVNSGLLCLFVDGMLETDRIPAELGRH